MNQQQERPLRVDELILSEDAVVAMPDPEKTKVVPSENGNDIVIPKHKRFRPFLLIYSLVLLVLTVGALIGVYSFLESYEATTPNAALNQYVEWLKGKNYTAIYDAAGFEETTLNNKNSYLQYLERIYSGDPQEITLRERPTVEEGQKQFSVYFDDKRVSILDLFPSEENDCWTVVPQLVYQKDYLVYASPDARITLNGEDIALLGISSKVDSEAVFYGLTDATSYPEVYCYTISGLLNPPVIEALSLAGKTCTIVSEEENPQTFYIYSPCDEETALSQEEFAKEAASTYAKFIARDASRNTLLKLIYKESTLYDSIRNFSNVWFPRHEKYEFKDIELVNPVRYTDTDFSCEVKFQPYYTQNGKTYPGEYVHYRMIFLRFEDEWKMIALTPVATNSDSTTSSTTTTETTTTTTVATTTTTA